MSHDEPGSPLEHPEVQVGHGKDYIVGYLLSVALTAVSYGLVHARTLPFVGLVVVVTLIACVLIGIQLYYSLGLDTSKSQRWNLAATALAVPLFVLMIVLTVWLFYTLQVRTALPG